MEILTLTGVSFSYDKNKNVLEDINLSVEKGEYIAIVGHNGSGKSTLAKLFNGLLVAEKGEVRVDNIKASNKKEDLFEIRKRVGVVFQNPDNQQVASIVEDDVAFGPENLGIEREEIGKRIDFALKTVGMEEFRESSPARLSGGQKQRIAIASVLAIKPEIMVLDEATAMLDPKGRREVLSVVKKLNKEEGVTVLTITHYMEEAVEADRIIVLDGGKIVANGTPEQIFSMYEVVESAGLELPPATRLAKKLKENGIDIPDGILTKERLAEELCKL